MAGKELSMFERFTEPARRVIVLAQEESRLLGHGYIGTEHLLLGIIHQSEGSAGDSPAARALDMLGLVQSEVRDQVEEILGRGQEEPSGHIPFSPRAKKVMEVALREGLTLDCSYVGPEHLLLAILDEREGVAARALTDLGMDLVAARQQIVELLESRPGHESPATLGEPMASMTGGPTAPSDLRLLLSRALRRIVSLEQRVAALEQRAGAGPDTGERDQGTE